MKVKISSLNLETTLDEFIKSWKNEINEELWEEFNEEGYLDDEYQTGLVMEKNEDNSVSIEITPDFSNIDIINSVYNNKYALLVKDVFGPLNDDFYHKLSDEEREFMNDAESFVCFSTEGNEIFEDVAIIFSGGEYGKKKQLNKDQSEKFYRWRDFSPAFNGDDNIKYQEIFFVDIEFFKLNGWKKTLGQFNLYEFENYHFID